MERISTIKVFSEESEEEEVYEIGVTTDEVDYKTQEEALKSLTEVLGEFGTEEAPIKNQLEEIKQTLDEYNISIIENTENISNIQRKIEEEIVPGLVGNVEELVDNRIDEKINEKNYLSSDIGWESGSQHNLREVLGNLINFPNQATSLRDWIESIENRLNEIENTLNSNNN